MGIQSGSDRTKKLYNRNLSNNLIYQTMEISKELGIFVENQIIIANIYETKDDLLCTIRLIDSLPKPFWLHVAPLALFPGTSIRDMAIKDGVAKYDDNFYKIAPDYFNIFMKSYYAGKGTVFYLNFILKLMYGLHSNKMKGTISFFLFKILTDSFIINLVDKNSFVVNLIANFFRNRLMKTLESKGVVLRI
jgi:radical SAM superfamily enzyme YgiQ (UPF0313 family)